MTDTVVEPSAANAEATAANDPIDLRLLGQRLKQLTELETEDQATDSLIRLARRLTRARAVVYFAEDSTGELSATPCSQCPDAVADSTINKLYSLGLMARSSLAIQIARTDEVETGVALAVPVLRPYRSAEVMVIVADAGEDMQRGLAGLVQITQFIAAFAAQWRGRFAELRSTRERSRVERFCQAILDAERSGQLTGAASTLADGVGEMFGASLVGIGLCRAGGLVKLIGMSNRLQFDRTSDLAKCLEAVMAESLLAASAEGFDDGEDEGRRTEALCQLQSILDADSIYRAPLKNAQAETIGACVVACDRPMTSGDRVGADLMQQLLGHELDLIRRARRGPIRRLIRTLQQLSKQRKQILGASFVLLLLVLFVLPVPHRLACRCAVQPITRRFVAAPYEGRLESALVEPGDWVQEGQILARMDAREIRLERAAIEADLVRSVKQRDTSLASRDTAAAQMAEYEMDRLKLKLQLLQDRMDNLDIKSPTVGVVISGDPKKLEGARLTMGQTLVEVGPLGEMVLEVAIPDEDIAYAQVGQQVQFRLESLPYFKFHGVLTRIHPRSEQQDAENVFIAEARIDEDNEILRPGMRGRAKIESESRSLFWVLFHGVWEQVLFKLGW